jgi:hypothetical protein
MEPRRSEFLPAFGLARAFSQSQAVLPVLENMHRMGNVAGGPGARRRCVTL